MLKLRVFDMNNKWLIPVVIVLAVLFVLVVAYIDDNPDVIDHSGERMSFNVSSGSSELTKVIKNIKTLPYYEGYDAKTVEWMESMGNKQVVFGDDVIVIMDGFEAMKIPYDVDVTDAYVYNYFTAEVVENHGLGVGHTTVYYVKNVKFTGQEIVGNGLA